MRALLYCALAAASAGGVIVSADWAKISGALAMRKAFKSIFSRSDPFAYIFMWGEVVDYLACVYKAIPACEQSLTYFDGGTMVRLYTTLPGPFEGEG